MKEPTIDELRSKYGSSRELLKLHGGEYDYYTYNDAHLVAWHYLDGLGFAERDGDSYLKGGRVYLSIAKRRIVSNKFPIPDRLMQVTLLSRGDTVAVIISYPVTKERPGTVAMWAVSKWLHKAFVYVFPRPKSTAEFRQIYHKDEYAKLEINTNKNTNLLDDRVLFKLKKRLEFVDKSMQIDDTHILKNAEKVSISDTFFEVADTKKRLDAEALKASAMEMHAIAAAAVEYISNLLAQYDVSIYLLDMPINPSSASAIIKFKIAPPFYYDIFLTLNNNYDIVNSITVSDSSPSEYDPRGYENLLRAHKNSTELSLVEIIDAMIRNYIIETGDDPKNSGKKGRARTISRLL